MGLWMQPCGEETGLGSQGFYTNDAAENIPVCTPGCHQCLDVPGGDVSDGVAMWIWDCSDESVQAFSINKQWQPGQIMLDQTTHKTSRPDEQLCLAGGAEVGAQITIQVCDETDASQMWHNGKGSINV